MQMSPKPYHLPLYSTLLMPNRCGGSRDFSLEFELEKGGYYQNIFLLLDHLFLSPFTRGNRIFLELFMSRPVGCYGLVASEVPYLGCMGNNKETRGAHHHVIFQVLWSYANHLLSPFTDLVRMLYYVQSVCFCFCEKLRGMGLLHRVRTGRNQIFKFDQSPSLF